MQDHFQHLAARYEELAYTVAQKETIDNQPLFLSLMKEMAELQPQVDAWAAFRATREEMDSVRELLHQPDYQDMAREELEQLQARLALQQAELNRLLMPQDADDQRDVVMEIRAGAGGEEAALFGASLLRMYTRYAERQHYGVSLMSISDTELGGVKEAVFTIEGRGAFSRLKYESGVHRIQRVPATESQGRIHTSTATVAVLPVLEDVEIDINPSDLRIDVFRATGQGGQHVNTTDSAVRITHLPTGLVVSCQNERSQIKNREQAMKVLKLRLYEQAREAQAAQHADHRRSQVGTGDRSERIRTYNFPQSRVTDHRIGLTLYSIDLIMDGDLDPLIDPLAQHAQQESMAHAGNGSA